MVCVCVCVCLTPPLVSPCSPGGSVGGGEPERDAVHVVPDGVCSGLQVHEQVRGGPEEVPRDREGESFSLTWAGLLQYMFNVLYIEHY